MTNLDISLKLIELQGEFSRTGVSVHNDWHETLNEVEHRLHNNGRPPFPRRESATNDDLIKTLTDIKKNIEHNMEMYQYAAVKYQEYLEAVELAITRLKETD